MGNVCCQEPTNTGQVTFQSIPVEEIQFEVYKGQLILDMLVKERFRELQSRLGNKLDESKYQGVVKREPHRQTHQNFIYEGTWKNDLPDGVGKILFKNGEYFQGQFEKGKAKGKGLYIFDNGDYYNGAIEDNKAEGRGAYIGSLIEYEGEWENSKPTIGNYLLTKDQTTIEMTDKNKGIIKWTNGNKYVGDIKNQKPDGSGRMQFNNGNQYDGQWRNGFCEGQGKYIWANGRSYDGQYVNGVKQGFGEFIYSDNKKYKGDWKNGKQHGYGKLIQNDNVIYEGYFKDGETSTEKPESNIYFSQQLPQQLNYEPKGFLNESRNKDSHLIKRT